MKHVVTYYINNSRHIFPGGIHHHESLREEVDKMTHVTGERHPREFTTLK